MTKAYLVQYYGGQWEDKYKIEIFVTLDESKAIKYVDKFNNMLHKWSSYYFDVYKTLDMTHADDYNDDDWNCLDRYNRISDITACCYKEIEIR